MKRKKKRVIKSEELVSNIWISILLPLASLFITYAVSVVIKRTSVSDAIIAMAAIIALCAGLEYIVLRIFISSAAEKTTSTLKDEADKVEKSELSKVDAMGFEGVCPEEELADMETQSDYSEIWLVSYDLLEEIDEGIYANVVENNVRRGIKYIYFTPKTQANTARIKMIKKRCNNNPNLSFYYLKPSFFFLVSEIDFAIYNPYGIDEGAKRRGYMGLNIEGLSDRYAVSMNDELVDTIINKLSENINDEYMA